MIKLESMIRLAVLCALTALIAMSCKDQSVLPQEKGISDDIRANFEALGFDVSDIEMIPTGNPLEGKVEESDYLL